MAAKGWTTQVAAAAGVAAATGAAQLGLGYGLGVVVWPVTPGADDSVWLGSLGWATWIAASSTVFGAIIAAALRGTRPSGPLRAGLAFAAGVGALLTVALVALPARLASVRADGLNPEQTAALYAGIGIVLGVLIAYWAVISGPVAANLIATSAYLWALAATAIVVELTAGRPAATYLTSWQFASIAEDSRYGAIYWPSALITLGAAFLLGVLAAWPAARRGNHGVGTAASGAVGPTLVGAAFLLLAPQLTGAIGQLQSAYLIAPYAVLAGLAGSAVVTTAAHRRAATSPAASAPAASSPGASAPAGAPTDSDEDDWSEAIGHRPPSRTKRTRPAAEPPRQASVGSTTRQPRESAPGPAARQSSTSASPRQSSPATAVRQAPSSSPARESSSSPTPRESSTSSARRQSSASPASSDPEPASGADAPGRRQPAPHPDKAPPTSEKPSRRGGLFGRRKQDTPDDEPTLDLKPPPTEKPSRGGLFGRRRQSYAADPAHNEPTDDEPTADLGRSTNLSPIQPGPSAQQPGQTKPPGAPTTPGAPATAPSASAAAPSAPKPATAAPTSTSAEPISATAAPTKSPAASPKSPAASTKAPNATAPSSPARAATEPGAATKAPAPAADPFKPSAVTRPRKGTSTRKQTTPPAERRDTDEPKTDNPRPADAAPRKSTVAAPPASPPIAKINPPREPD